MKVKLEPKCYSYCPKCNGITLHGWEDETDPYITCLICGCKHK